MKAGVFRVPGRTTEDHLVAMSRGLMQHGIAVEFFQTIPPADIDFAVVWSWGVGLRVREYFPGPILVMERGYIGDRFAWTSLGWDGLNGRARFTRVDDASRFEFHFGELLRPQRGGTGYALIIGQVKGDAALIGANIEKWYRETGVALWKSGWDVRFRQHPVEVERGIVPPHISFATPVHGSLEDALEGAGLVVTYNSNTGVDAVLAGAPVHAADPGSMVYDLASHDLTVTKPNRLQRLHEMAWFQWSTDEIISGDAWDIVKESMEA